MSAITPTLKLAKQLIAKPSVTPNDAGCQQIITDRLKKAGFICEHMPSHDVDNLWAMHGTSGPLFVFAGHTDVVPAGEGWKTDPFTPTVDGDRLIGRGAADMKGAVAAMVVACEHFVVENPKHPGRIAILLTSDEEGEAEHGTKHVIEQLQQRGEHIDYCIVGEASSDKTLGDRIRVGRRGSLHASITIHGKQGHVAYPERADNPLNKSFLALDALCKHNWDKANDHFPETTMQISNLHAGSGALNVTPGSLQLNINFRFGEQTTPKQLQQQTETILKDHGLNFNVTWQCSSKPFLSKPGKLTQTVCDVIQEQLGITPELSTGGGTSDGRFIAPTGAEVIELGVLGDTIHQVNEWVGVLDLSRLTQLYINILAFISNNEIT